MENNSVAYTTILKRFAVGFIAVVLSAVALPSSHAKDKISERTKALHINEQFYKDLGLEWIVQYSNPITNSKINPKGAKHLYLGPVNSKQKRCVMLLRLVDIEKACSKASCIPLFQFYDEQELKYEGKETRLKPYVDQFVLLSTPCDQNLKEKPAILFSNHPEDTQPRPDGYQCHVLALSVERYNQSADLDPNEIGSWMQKQIKSRYIIEFRTEASEGILEWSPTKGYSWSETEP